MSRRYELGRRRRRRRAGESYRGRSADGFTSQIGEEAPAARLALSLPLSATQRQGNSSSRLPVARAQTERMSRRRPELIGGCEGPSWVCWEPLAGRSDIPCSLAPSPKLPAASWPAARSSANQSRRYESRANSTQLARPLAQIQALARSRMLSGELGGANECASPRLNSSPQSWLGCSRRDRFSQCADQWRSPAFKRPNPASSSHDDSNGFTLLPRIVGRARAQKST